MSSCGGGIAPSGGGCATSAPPVPMLIAPAVWVMLPYRIAQDEAGLRRDYCRMRSPASKVFSPRRRGFICSCKRAFLEPFAKEADAYLFPGILVLILAAIAVLSWSAFARASRDKPAQNTYVMFYLVIAILSTLMFVDRPFELWRYVYWLPGFNFIRVPSRFIILTMLALAVLAGFGVDRIAARLPRNGAHDRGGVRSPRWSRESIRAIPSAACLTRSRCRRSIAGWIHGRSRSWSPNCRCPAPAIWARSSVSKPNRCCIRRRTGRKRFMATAAFAARFTNSSTSSSPRFLMPTSINGLRDVGVSYVVVHTDDYGGRWPRIEEQITKTPALRLEHVEGAGRVYRLLPH